MNVQHILDDLFAMTFHAGIKPGLERITELCSGLGDPHLRLNTIHVAGTNGKGSTCSILASILTEAGYNVGLYTSPHVRKFNERIRINGVAISDQDVARLAVPLMEQAKTMGGTFFEVTTAMAFEYFAERRVDVAVIETGLGGRLDATNICQPIVSIITAIDYDHMEYLGTTITQIAGEKAGIIKQGVPAVIGPNSAEACDVFERRAEATSSELIFSEDVVSVDVDAFYADLTMSVSVIRADTRQYYVSELTGQHQAANIGTAIAALGVLERFFAIDDEDIRRGLRSIRRNSGILARTQIVPGEPTTIIDVSHNAAGLHALVRTLMDSRIAGPLHVVFGAMADKDVEAMLTELLPLNATLHLCAPHIARSMPLYDLVAVAKHVGHEHIIEYASVAEAVQGARAAGTTVICGSFHVADEAADALNVIG
ncbi:MAG: bifunctional folylpolyglutamate synthase/dihydrofolate synthase [Candidatus Kapabacteria bacterium]|nr:bifunctional folylpolyglutamate synthase/dihydrofolate synthase [Candidatus Kapabacteria bacterium]